MKKKFIHDGMLLEDQFDHVLRKALVISDRLNEANALPGRYIGSLEIQNAFSQDASSKNSVNAQLLLVVFLHKAFLENSIKFINNQLQRIFDTKRYWLIKSLEVSLLCLPMFLKNKKVSKKLLDAKIIELQQLEESQAELLGICLLSKLRLQKIENVDQIKIALQFALEPFAQFEVDSQNDSATTLFKEISLLHSSTEKMQKSRNKLLKDCSIPSHFERNFYTYSALTAICLGSALALYKYKDCKNEYREKTQRAMHGLWQDALLRPFQGLKRALWDRPDFGAKKFDLDDVPNSIWACYTPERVFKYPLLTVLHNFNKGIDVAEEIVKGQQINYYLSSTMPVIGGFYAIYQGGKHYNNYESYFKSMRMSLRNINVLFNRLDREKGLSYRDIGYVFAWVSQLQKYVGCLSMEEKKMIEEDLDELTSFDFTIKQKQKVIERMHRTYAFLK